MGMDHHPWVDADALRAALSTHVRPLLSHIDSLASVDSTNNYLLAAAEAGQASGSVCLAACQTAGRGRRGREWVSPPGGNLYLSLLWRYPTPPARLPSLSIATGLAVAQTLRDLGIKAIQLKWPNDLHWQGRKLGGLLLETRIGTDCIVVAGIGINGVVDAVQASIDQPWIDLATVLNTRPDIQALAVRLLNRLLPLYRDYPDNSTDFSVAWSEFDSLAEQPVTIEHQGQYWHGIARGIDADGQLRVATTQGLHVFSSGAVSVRMSV